MTEEQLYDEAFEQMGQAPPEHGENLGPRKRGRKPGAAYGKWGGGAQPKPPEQKAKRFTITLEPGLLQWVDSLGDKRSQTIARLLTEARERLSVA
jgi:hypothetical protein